MQGGIGTAEEADFLMDYYGVNSTGWGTPFLLCPEATTVDDVTLNQLSLAKEKMLFLVNFLRLVFASITLKEPVRKRKQKRIDSGLPGVLYRKAFGIEYRIYKGAHLYSITQISKTQDQSVEETEFA